jgi:hypothetical protein
VKHSTIVAISYAAVFFVFAAVLWIVALSMAQVSGP